MYDSLTLYKTKKHIVLFTPYCSPDDNIVITLQKFIKTHSDYKFTYKYSEHPGSKTINILIAYFLFNFKYSCHN